MIRFGEMLPLGYKLAIKRKFAIVFGYSGMLSALIIACASQIASAKPHDELVEAASPQNNVIGNKSKKTKIEAQTPISKSKKPVKNKILASNDIKPKKYGRIENTEIGKSPQQEIIIPPTKIANLEPKIVEVSQEDMAHELGMVGSNSQNPVRTIDVAPWQKIGQPYQVNGTWYIPSNEPEYDEIGTASWYGEKFNGRVTANGEIFDMNLVTVAHPTLPIPSLVEITNLENGRSIVARANDRGPFHSDRIIDISKRGAELLGFIDQGNAKVRVRYIGQADPAKIQNPPSEYVDVEPEKKNIEIRYADNKPVKKEIAPVNVANNVKSSYFVQIGAFSKIENAKRTAKENKNFQNIVISDPKDNSKGLYLVLLGPFESESKAKIQIKTAQEAGIEGARLYSKP